MDVVGYTVITVLEIKISVTVLSSSHTIDPYVALYDGLNQFGKLKD